MRRTPRENALNLIAFKPVKELEYRVKNLSFHNLTPAGTKIPHGLKTVLGLSTKFCPTPKHLDISTYSSALPFLFRSIRLGFQFPGSSDNYNYNKLIYVPNPNFQPVMAPPLVENLFREISNIIPQEQFHRFHWNLNRNQRRILRDLRFQKDLKILQSDKNLGPVIMTTAQYYQFCNDHLNQPDVYQSVPEIPLGQIKDNISSFHKRLISDFPFEERNARIIVAFLDKSETAYFHGIPKIHKTPMACRPIVSNVSAPTNGLSKWLAFQLMPYSRRLTSFLKNSSELQDKLKDIPFDTGCQFYTFDVENMYTSIPIREAIQATRYFLDQRQTPLASMILEGLEIVMTNNYFTFGSSKWKQLLGLAMGTPVAPVLATLYLGYYEETRIISQFRNNLLLYVRYLDDLFIIWNPIASQPFAFNRFRAVLRQVPGLSWTFDHHPKEANFLDLWVYKFQNSYGTRTHQKVLNLYLYPPFQSAHPPGVMKGFITGILLKYKEQNTKLEDFKHMATLFFNRLINRGYHPRTLKPYFEEILSQITAPASGKRKRDDNMKQFFFKVPYDPNGPTRQQLRSMFKLDQLSESLSDIGLGRIVICYTKPPNIGNLLMRTRDGPITSAPAEQVQDARGVNPNPNPA